MEKLITKLRTSFTKKFLILLLCCGMISKLTAQVSVTATAGTTGPSLYTTVNAAFAAINAGTHQGVIRITVTANTTEPSAAVPLLASGTPSSYTSVIIKPSGNVTISGNATGVSGRGVLEFLGADSVTIDGDDPFTTGSRNLTIQRPVATTTLMSVIRFASATASADGATKNVVKNCIILGSRSTVTSTVVNYGIYSGTAGSVAGTATGTSYDNDSITIDNNDIERTYCAIYQGGTSATTIGGSDNWNIINNQLGPNTSGTNSSIGQWAIKVNNAIGFMINNNIIQNLSSSTSGTGTATAAGMNIGTSINMIITKNILTGIENVNTSGYGIRGITINNSTAASNTLVANNMLTNIWGWGDVDVTLYGVYGITLEGSSGGVSIIHNSINLYGSHAGYASAGTTSTIYVATSNGNIDIRNNILTNTYDNSSITGDLKYCIYSSSANTVFSNINYNDYYVSGTDAFLGNIGGTNRGTLASMVTGFGGNANSIISNPPYTSATNLHLTTGTPSGIESAGVAITGFTSDIDGDVRPGPSGSTYGGGTSPDIGADEADLSFPTTPSVRTGTKANITTNAADVSGTIVNDGGNTITATGIVLSTSPSPTRGSFGVVDSATNPLVSLGNFTKTFNGLFTGTTYYYRTYAVNGLGTGYGPDSSFTTNSSASVPTVFKVAATNINATTVTVGGNITLDGGSTVTASGIVYATTSNPALFGTGVVDSTTTPLVTTGTFNINPAGLTHSTKYYYRAYATNSVGTAYSIQDSFTTAPIISVLPYTQNFDGTTITGWGSLAIGTGVNEWIWGTPAKTRLTAAYSTPKCWFTATATYSNYHDAAVVSPQFDFSGMTANPIVRFRHNFITEAGYDASVLEISINNGTWTRLDNTLGTGTNFNTTNSTSWYNSSSTNGPLTPSKWSSNSNLFSSNVSNWIQSQTPLTGAAGQSNVRFRIRFVSDVSGVDEGLAFDNVEVFEPTAPVVVTGTKSNITTASADLSGNIISNGNSAVTASGVVFSLSPSPTRGSFGVVDSVTNPSVALGTFTKAINGLFNATTYYYRAYAVNTVGTSYGADSTFTTNASATIPTISRIAATNLTLTSASIGGNITSDGGSSVTASGVVYATTPNPILFGFGVIDSTTTPLVTMGAFNINPAGLTHSTKYYFKAYATNSIGTAYSTLDSFTTAPIVSTFPYAQNFDGISTVSTGWSSITTGGSNEWVLATPAKIQLNGAYSSPSCWFTASTGDYSNGHNGAVVSPQFDFSSISVNPIVKFRHNFITEAGWDGSVLEISINNGTWTRLDSTTGNGTNFNTTNSTSWYNNTSTSGPMIPSKWSQNSNLFSSNVSNWIQSQTVLTGAAGQPNVRFRIRFASDGSGTAEGWAFDNVEVLVPTVPVVVTGTKSNITTSTADLSGNITSNGNAAITASGVVFSLSPAPTRGGFGVVDSTTNPLVSLGTFTKGTSGLFTATSYYYRAYAVNAVGISYGADSIFTTNSSAVIPTVSRIGATNLTATSARVGGNITSDGGSTVTASGVVYATTSNPLRFGVGVIDSATSPVVSIGTYNVNPIGLTSNTKYYFRAYAINSIGTAYSSLDSFTTDPIISVLPYTQNFESGNAGWNSMLTSTSTSVNWILGFATNNNWVLGTPAKTYLSGARSGTKAWVTKLTGDYDIDHDASVVSPQFNFTSYSSDPIVRFSHKFKAELDWDGLIIEQSINGGFWTRVDSIVGTGTNFNTANSYAWYNDNVDNVSSGGILTPPYFCTDLGSSNVYSSSASGWIESAFRLTGAAGQSNVRFRFRFISDTYVTDEGCAIDDIEVVNISTPTTAASSVTLTGITNSSITVNWTNGNGQRRLVVARLTSGSTVAPTNNTMYTANATFSSGSTTGTGNYVVYDGTGSTVTVTGLALLTNYTFRVYEYNGKYMHNSFAAGATNNATTLPVKLVSFNAKKVNENVQLRWITASETNNKGFEVQRSVDGKSFKTIDFIKGEGNSSSNVTYSKMDENAFANNKVQKLYYRLNQIDFDGKSTLTEVKEVSINDLISEDVKVYPNPFTNELTIETLNTENAISIIEVIDISGRVLINQSTESIIGTNSIKVNNTNSLAAGVYFVKITNNGVVKTMKVVKQ